MALLTDRLANLDLQRASLQQQYQDAGSLMDQHRQQNAVQALLIMLERSRISTAISELDSGQPALAQKILPPQTRPTELLGEITTPTKPSKRKKALILVLSAVLGVMGDVMLALVSEFVSSPRAPRAAALG